MKKYLFSIFLLTIIIIITIKNENLIFQNSSLQLETKNLITPKKIFLPINKDDGRIKLISNNKLCIKYIKDDIISFQELNRTNNNHYFNVFSKRENINNCTFHIVIFKRHPNPFIALFFVHLPIIIILYLSIRVFSICYKRFILRKE